MSIHRKSLYEYQHLFHRNGFIVRIRVNFLFEEFLGSNVSFYYLTLKFYLHITIYGTVFVYQLP